MVYGHGINDMPYGWTNKSEKNCRIYKTWCHMLERCYSEKYHKTRPTYKSCSVCNRWLLFSNFVEDYKLIDSYNEEKFLKGKLVLDKDIKSNGENKEYSLKNCMWVSKSENSRQATKTRDYSDMQGENHSRSVKIAQYDKQGNLIRIWGYINDAQHELGIASQSISACCKFWEMNCNKEEWFKTHKNRPYKSAGGFIWKYYNEYYKK